MLRAAAVMLGSGAVASTRPLVLRRAISTGPGLDLSSHRHRPIPRHDIPTALLSRGIARMRRRIPPVPPKQQEEEEAESESEDDKHEVVELDVDEVEDGEESEEWEGFVLDFGADDQVDKKDRPVDEEEP